MGRVVFCNLGDLGRVVFWKWDDLSPLFYGPSCPGPTCLLAELVLNPFRSPQLNYEIIGTGKAQFSQICYDSDIV